MSRFRLLPRLTGASSGVGSAELWRSASVVGALRLGLVVTTATTRQLRHGRSASGRVDARLEATWEPSRRPMRSPEGRGPRAATAEPHSVRQPFPAIRPPVRDRVARAAHPEKGVRRPAAPPGRRPDREGSNRVRTLNHDPRASGVDRRGRRAHPRRGDADAARDGRLHRPVHAGRPEHGSLHRDERLADQGSHARQRAAAPAGP